MLAEGNTSIKLTVTPEMRHQIDVIRAQTGESKTTMLRRLIEKDFQLIQAGFKVADQR